jgi:CO/xanthine dehydrogenase FAD-binding subunit
MAQEEALLAFADGLVPAAIGHVKLPGDTWSLASALHHPGLQVNPLVTALLVLDAEVTTVIDDRARVFPLPGFLTYRPSLSLDRISLSTLRLPPLNPDGHYLLSIDDDDFCFALRLDLHPGLKVAGHVRLAVAGSDRLPQRLQATEHRLERQVFEAELIEAAVAAGSEELSPPLTHLERVKLVTALAGLLEE